MTHLRIDLLSLLVAAMLSGIAAQTPDDRYPIVKDGKLGFIDARGTEVIAPQFQPIADMSNFREGLAWVAGPLGSGYIDANGRYVIGPQRDWGQGRPFQEGIASVLMWGRNGTANGPVLIDRTGRVVMSGETVKEGYSYFSEGLMAVSDSGKTGFVDKQLQWVIKPQFSDARAFSEGKAAVQIGGNWGYIDMTGRTVVPARYDWVWPFSDGLALVRVKIQSQTLFGFVDASGRERIPPRFTSATSFRGDRALVRSPGEALAIIDKSANFIGEVNGDLANEFSEGLAAVRAGELWGFVDLFGVWTITPRFTRADSFWHGLARVAWPGGQGYIDKTGRTVWSSATK
jgi:hypothetical protein